MAPSVPRSTAYTRTLALAAESLGGVHALAKRLKAEPAALERWIAGEEFPPHEAFLQALDIVAAGPRADPAARPAAGRAQAHADRLQAAANRVRETAERMQASARLAQAQSELVRAQRKLTEPEPSSSGEFRQVQPRDGAPASNKPGEDEQGKAKG